jgi:Rrf2 family cysteine metabolism transcriptional repressor
MTLLSRKADYALLILSYLHHKAGGGNAREIAEKFGLSRPFVANILKELCQKGFVASHRGVKGGYALQRPASSVNLGELLDSIEDGFRLTVCNSDDHAHEGDCAVSALCTLKRPMAEVHRRLMEVLRNVKLDELFGNTLVSPEPLLHALSTACCVNAAPPVELAVP